MTTRFQHLSFGGDQRLTAERGYFGAPLGGGYA